jgi:A1 cistron-splicing factor AAR2
VISDDHLRSLDPGLAAYPFDGLEAWKSSTSSISEDLLLEVLGPRGISVDGLRGVEGDRDDLAVSGQPEGVVGMQEGGGKMRFVQFDLRRSWRDGAVGEELTRWARDKSWLLASVLEGVGRGKLIDPILLRGRPS